MPSSACKNEAGEYCDIAPETGGCGGAGRDRKAVCRFFSNDTATTEIYTLSLHDALPIWPMTIFGDGMQTRAFSYIDDVAPLMAEAIDTPRSEEHTSELQSPYVI